MVMKKQPYDPKAKVINPNNSQQKQKMAQDDNLHRVDDPNQPGATSYQRGNTVEDAGSVSDTTDAATDFQGNWGVDTETPVMGGDPDVDLYEGNRFGTPQIDEEIGQPHTREVQQEETVQHQLSQLLSGDSKYMQDARRQGLEQANAAGGLGGTVGVGASMQSALRAGLPIAQQDAATYAQAASENMQALNDFEQLNHQRATQLALGTMDANSRVMTANIGASAQIASQRLQNAASRDIAKLDAATRERVTQMQGAIQARLADNQFKYNQILNDAQYAAELAKTKMQGDYGLAGTGLSKEWDHKIQSEMNAMQREANYTNTASGVYEGYLNRIAELNGMEMDDAARNAAIKTITDGAVSHMGLLNELYSDLDPIEFDWG